MKRVVLLLASFFFAHSAWGAAAYDAVSSTQIDSLSGGTPQTWSHTVTGSNPVLYCAASWDEASAQTVTAFTYNSVSLSSVATDSNGGRHVHVWKLVAPSTGTHNVSVTLSGLVDLVAGCISLTGVDQGTPNGSAVTSNTVGTSISDTITIPASGIGIDFGVVSNDSCPAGLSGPGGSQTSRYSLCTASNNVGGYASTDVTTGSQAMSWSFGSTSNLAHVAIPINGATAATRRPLSAIVFE